MSKHKSGNSGITAYIVFEASLYYCAHKKYTSEKTDIQLNCVINVIKTILDETEIDSLCGIMNHLMT